MPKYAVAFNYVEGIPFDREEAKDAGDRVIVTRFQGNEVVEEETILNKHPPIAKRVYLGLEIIDATSEREAAEELKRRYRINRMLFQEV